MMEQVRQRMQSPNRLVIVLNTVGGVLVVSGLLVRGLS